MKKNIFVLLVIVALPFVAQAHNLVCPNTGEYDDTLPSTQIFPCSLPAHEKRAIQVKNFIGEYEDKNDETNWSSTAFINHDDGIINLNFLSAKDEVITLIYKNCDEHEVNPLIESQTITLSPGVPVPVSIQSTCTKNAVNQKWGSLNPEDKELMGNIARMVEITVELGSKSDWSGHHVLVSVD